MKKKIFNPLVIGLALGTVVMSQALSQNYVEKFQASYGGSGDDGGDFNYIDRSDLKAIPGGLIFGGMSNSPIGANKSAPNKGGYDYWVIKTDLSGNKIWDKTYGGSADDHLAEILPTSDGGYLLTGESMSLIGGDKTSANFGSFDVWIVKIDANGNKLWDKSYGGNSSDYAVESLSEVNGKYYVGVACHSGISGNKTVANNGLLDYGIIALDANNGNIVFEKGYGGSNNDDLHTIHVNNDGSFMLFGGSLSGISGNKTTASLGNWDYWIVSCNANGQVLWNKSFGGTGIDALDDAKIVKRSNGTYCFVIAGRSNSNSNALGMKSENTHGGYDYWLVAIEPNGTKIWDHTYGGTLGDIPLSIELHRKNNSIIDSRNSSLVSQPNPNTDYDDQIIISGFSNSDAYVATNGYKTDNNMGPSDGWIVFVDPVNGQQFKDVSLGGDGDDATQTTLAINVNSSGNIIPGDIDYISLSFTTTGINGTKTTPSSGGYDMWLYNLSKCTFCSPSSITAENTDSNIHKNAFLSSLYPTVLENGYPIHLQLEKGISNDETSIFDVAIYSITGQQVFNHQLKYDESHSILVPFPSKGIYIVNVSNQNKEIILKQRISVIK